MYGHALAGIRQRQCVRLGGDCVLRGRRQPRPGVDRERALLVPNAKQRGELWTPRVWPGAVLVDGEIVGTWRRAKRVLTIDAWKKLSQAAKDAVTAEADTLPLPDPGEGMTVHWS